MIDWEIVKNDTALLKKVEELVNEVADIYYDFPQDICDKLNSLTGNNWSGEEYLEYCAGYWESPWSLQEIVYALFHDGEFLDREEIECYAWDIDDAIDRNDTVISFFRFGQYEKDPEKTKLYHDLPIKKIFEDLKQTFADWENNSESWEEDEYDCFRCTKNVTYGREKEIHIYAAYDNKFLNITLTNLDDSEREVLEKTLGKYVSFYCQEE